MSINQPITGHPLSHLVHILQLAVSLGLFLGEEDTIPRRPLFSCIPPHHHQLKEMPHGTQHTLATPDVLHKIAQVGLLGMGEKRRARSRKGK